MRVSGKFYPDSTKISPPPPPPPPRPSTSWRWVGHPLYEYSLVSYYPQFIVNNDSLQNPRARRISGAVPSVGGPIRANPITIFDNPQSKDQEIW